LYENGEETRITDLWTVCLGAWIDHALKDANYGPDDCGFTVRCPARAAIFWSKRVERVWA